MAARGAATTSAASTSSRPTSSATGSGRPTTSPPAPPASSTATGGWSRYGEVGGTGRGDACVHPDYRGRGIGTWLAQWMQRTPPASGAPLVGDAGARRARRATGCSRRSATASAGRAGSSSCPRAAGSSTGDLPAGYVVREADPDEYEPPGTCSRTRSSSGRSATGTRSRTSRPTSVRRPGFEPWHLRVVVDDTGGRRRRRPAHRCSPRTTRPRSTCRGSPPARTSAAAVSPRRCWPTAFAAGRERGAPAPASRHDSRTGALGLYEKVGMVVRVDLGEPRDRRRVVRARLD